MKTKNTNIYYIDASGMTSGGTKMVQAIKEELRKCNHHIIEADLLPTWLEELRVMQDELLTQHNWKRVRISLESMDGCNVRWLCLDGDCATRIIRPLGELTL